MSYPKKPIFKDNLVTSPSKNSEGIKFEKKDHMKSLIYGKMKTILVKKGINLDSKTEDVIAVHVHRFVENEEFTEAALQKLEQRITKFVSRSLSSKYSDATKSVKSRNSQMDKASTIMSVKSKISDTSKLSQCESVKEMKRASSQPGLVGAGKAALDDWAKVVEMDRIRFEKEKEYLGKMRKINQSRIKEELDHQITEKKMAKQKERDHEDFYYSVAVKTLETQD
jgi:hypothetical protein